MKNQKQVLFFIGFLFFCQILYAQETTSRFSGNLQADASFFMRDSAIGAINTPQYDHQLYGANSWLQLNYSNWGFDLGMRFDLFNNSNLLNPNGSYTAQGIGRWFIKKKVKKLGIEVGYLYDQIGTGIVFRAYEQRALALDNALYGVKLSYDIAEEWKIKAFTGKQKRQFDTYEAILRGINIDGFLTSSKEGSSWSLAPGFAVVGRTLSDETVNTIVNTISTYSVVDSIGAKYSTYAVTLYNTLTLGDFSWYVEGAYKSAEQYFDPNAIKTSRTGDTSLGKLVFNSGSVLYTSLGYANNGWGITLDAKRTHRFSMRNTPFVTGNQGVINFLPAMTRVNTYRLTARYSPATQELGEAAIQADISYAPSRKWRFNVNFSNITSGLGSTDSLLYREVFTKVAYKYKRKWSLVGGIQFQQYNQEVYEFKPGVPLVTTIVPYTEFLYRFTRKKSLRFEAQYMNTDEDLGGWIFALVELNFAPHWSFSVSDMYNYNPSKDGDSAIHYPRFDVFYTNGANRFSLSYIKQVQGIVCAGGVCRLEPAFSGVRATVSSTF